VKRDVPGPDETAEAMKAADDRQLHLGEIRQLFLEAFEPKCPLQHFGLFCYDDAKFHAFVKLLDASDIEIATGSDLAQRMRDFIFEKLEAFGRGRREEITVDLEFDYLNRPRNPVPFDHEARWARAKAAIAEQNEHLDEVTTLFNERFAHCTPLDHFAISGAGDHRFGAAIFFRKHDDIVEAERNGLDREMMECIYGLLTKFGRGEREELDVEFEFDSRENVDRNFEGSYFLRLR